MKRRLNSELGVYLTGPGLDELRRRLARRTGRSFDDVDRMPISEVAALPWDAPAGPPAGPSPPIGADGPTGQTEAAGRSGPSASLGASTEEGTGKAGRDASMGELADLLDELDSFPPPDPPGTLCSGSEFMLAMRERIYLKGDRDRIREQIDGINGIGGLKLICYRETGREPDAPCVRRMMADLADRLRLTLEAAKGLTVARAAVILAETDPPTDCAASPPNDPLAPVGSPESAAGPPPSIGSDGRTEAVAGSDGSPRENRKAAGADASEPPSPAPDELPDLVTLNQAAGMVHRDKRTLERYKTKGELPAPAVEGGGGRQPSTTGRRCGPGSNRSSASSCPRFSPPTADTHKRSPTDNRRQPHATAPPSDTVARVDPMFPHGTRE